MSVAWDEKVKGKEGSDKGLSIGVVDKECESRGEKVKAGGLSEDVAL